MNPNENTLDHPPSGPRPLTPGPHKRGPKTPEGKRRSRMNALHHGRYAKTEEARRLLEERKREEQGPPLEEIEQEMQEFFQPKNALDRRLVSHVAFCLWRLARTQQMERRAAGNLITCDSPTGEMDRIVTYERRVELQLLRSLAALGYTQVPKHFLRGNDLFPRSE